MLICNARLNDRQGFAEYTLLIRSKINKVQHCNVQSPVGLLRFITQYGPWGGRWAGEPKYAKPTYDML